MPPIEFPPAIHQSVDLNRLIFAIEEKENGEWGNPGGKSCFTKTAWEEDTKLPYIFSARKAQNRIIMRQRLEKCAARLLAAGIVPDVYLLANFWRHGFAGMLNQHRRKIYSAYAGEVENLYGDKSWMPKW